MKNRNGRQPNPLRVLTYHRVANFEDRPWLNPGLISATPDMFCEQMEFLYRNYCVVSIEQVLEAVERKALLPNRAVLITFDDAYRDFAENAWPILKRLNLATTLFVPTAYPGHPERLFWWDKLHQVFSRMQESVSEIAPIGSVSHNTPEERRRQGLKQFQGYIKNLPDDEAMKRVDELYDRIKGPKVEAAVLDWEELRQLTKDGVTLGAHTRTHPALTRVGLETAREEITASQTDLKREIGTVLPIFSYPDGRHDESIVDILKEEGFQIAFNGPAGCNDLSSCDPYRIRRINITPRTSPIVFRLRLARWFTPIDRFRHRKRIRDITSSYCYYEDGHARTAG
ncbi:polysaccharide deacetylase family protein [candidate division KSB1 bacterium]|nr:polysaccharide deacetylase family protein [candidate division KSB1 bacterium]NIR69701.1 polysaccharide deacetylase family protein [candidate division KSB1 bacterium]NIS24897.1 polysaccharide deacetylase family protein [candidate division KSB1 bacterium]NIT69746.1 polysaccharide deacetylase family protein [candidate division KSB1 bacterium]NIU23416.1 polysaccharide deacetylase family protein [candidate division KSB1 bacterium]